VPIGIRELLDLALANPFFIPLKEPRLSVVLEKGSFFLKAEAPDTGDEYLIWFDDTHQRPQRILVTRTSPGTGSTESIRVDFDNYQESGSLMFPFYIRVTDLGKGDFFELNYQKLEFNRDLPEVLFRVGPLGR